MVNMASYAIVGDLGGGKTAILTYLGVMYYRQGFNLFSTYDISLPLPNGQKRSIVTRVNTIKDFENIKKGYLLGDELWSLFDSHKWSEVSADMLLKARKRDYTVVDTVQHFSQLNNRIRNITNYVIYPQKEIRNPRTGALMEVDVDIIHPIDMKPYLPFTEIHAYVCSLNPITDEFDRLVQEFRFPLLPVTLMYDTNEEVEFNKKKSVAG